MDEIFNIIRPCNVTVIVVTSSFHAEQIIGDILITFANQNPSFLTLNTRFSFREKSHFYKPEPRKAYGKAHKNTIPIEPNG